MAREPGCRRQALVSRVKCEGAVAGSVARWPLRGAKKEDFDRTLIDLYIGVRGAFPKLNVEALTQNLN